MTKVNTDMKAHIISKHMTEEEQKKYLHWRIN